MDFPTRLRDAMQYHRHSAPTLAKKLGRHENTILNWRSGRTRPTDADVVALEAELPGFTLRSPAPATPITT